MDDRHRKDAGLSAENAALQYLLSQGLELVARNFRCRTGEIDLVMLERAAPAPRLAVLPAPARPPTLVLIEVRYRADADFGGAAASVYWRKQHRIVRAAQYLLLRRPELRKYRARFDVVALSPAPRPANARLTGRLQIEWLRHAFAA